MAVNIENITRPLAAPGVLKKTSVDLYDSAVIIITLEFSAGDLAGEAYDTLADELQQDNFRLGSLNIRREG